MKTVCLDLDDKLKVEHNGKKILDIEIFEAVQKLNGIINLNNTRDLIIWIERK